MGADFLFWTSVLHKAMIESFFLCTDNCSQHANMNASQARHDEIKTWATGVNCIYLAPWVTPFYGLQRFQKSTVCDVRNIPICLWKKFRVQTSECTKEGWLRLLNAQKIEEYCIASTPLGGGVILQFKQNQSVTLKIGFVWVPVFLNGSGRPTTHAPTPCHRTELKKQACIVRAQRVLANECVNRAQNVSQVKPTVGTKTHSWHRYDCKTLPSVDVTGGRGREAQTDNGKGITFLVRCNGHLLHRTGQPVT